MSGFFLALLHVTQLLWPEPHAIKHDPSKPGERQGRVGEREREIDRESEERTDREKGMYVYRKREQKRGKEGICVCKTMCNLSPV